MRDASMSKKPSNHETRKKRKEVERAKKELKMILNALLKALFTNECVIKSHDIYRAYYSRYSYILVCTCSTEELASEFFFWLCKTHRDSIFIPPSFSTRKLDLYDKTTLQAPFLSHYFHLIKR